MRITGGIYKGRMLKTMPGLRTRPTTDKIRQSIFNVLMHDIEGKSVLDLFAGSGALGIEAVSRGGESAVFVESGIKQVSIIKENLNSLGLDAEIIDSDYIVACQLLSDGGKKFDIVFADPPYKEIMPLEVVKTICQYGLLSSGGLFIIEHKFGQPVETELLKLIKQRKFGQTEVSFFIRK